MTKKTTVVDRTLQEFPEPREYNYHNLVLYFNQVGNFIEPWHGSPLRRDAQLAEFWKSEPFLSSAVTSIAMTRAALSWEITGPPKTVARVQKLLNSSDFGKGWQHLMMQVNIDLLTTDNGAFIEVIRQKPSGGKKPEMMPVIGLAHLASLKCIRTGNPLEPVIYIDRKGREHVMKWWQIITLTENPIPESPTGRQFCFVSRVLKYAQILKDIEKYNEEKVSGRFTQAIHVVSGVNQREMENIEERANLDRDNQGLMRYGQPLILTTLDPNATVSKETIELASMPDNFNMQETMTWYISLLALASGSDYQEFAPLSGGNLGTASQSDTLHRKSQRKGTQLFIKLIETGLVEAKAIPQSVAFQFKQQDAQAEQEQVEIEKTRAETRKIQIDSGEITPEVSRQIAVDKGDLARVYLFIMGEEDETPIVTVADDETIPEAILAADKASAKPRRLPIKTAWKAAQWITKLIEEHPVQSVSPIPDIQLLTFLETLRNMLTVEAKVGTNLAWMDYVLVKAAKEAGIAAHALRMRLPDEYEIYITQAKIWDNKGSLIYLAAKVQIKEQTFDRFEQLKEEFLQKFVNSDTGKYNLINKYMASAYIIGKGTTSLTEEEQQFISKEVEGKYFLFANASKDIRIYSLALDHMYHAGQNNR